MRKMGTHPALLNKVQTTSMDGETSNWYNQPVVAHDMLCDCSNQQGIRVFAATEELLQALTAW